MSLETDCCREETLASENPKSSEDTPELIDDQAASPSTPSPTKRKRGRPPKENSSVIVRVSEASQQASAEANNDYENAEDGAVEVVTPKRGRGRPPKGTTPSSKIEAKSDVTPDVTPDVNNSSEVSTSKKKRGRPTKNISKNGNILHFQQVI